MNKKEISVLAALVVTAVFSVLAAQIKEAQQIRDNTLRLHIIANSNTDTDQQYKLYIKDEILKMDEILPSKAENIDQAVSLVKGNLPVIEKRVNELLKTQNAPYTAACSVENFYFDTTQYTDFALPKGEYTALTIRLGKAQRKNWWCGMYPALCSSTFGELAMQDSSDFIKTQKPAARFRVVEIYEDIKTALTGKTCEEYKNIK